MTLFRAHADAKTDSDRLPHLSPDFRLTVSERPISLEELVQASQEGKILEAFGTGTAAVLCPVKRFVPALSLRHNLIRLLILTWVSGTDTDRVGLEDGRPDMEIPTYSGGLGPLARAVFERVSEIQEGKVPGHQWIVEI